MSDKIHVGKQLGKKDLSKRQKMVGEALKRALLDIFSNISDSLIKDICTVEIVRVLPTKDMRTAKVYCYCKTNKVSSKEIMDKLMANSKRLRMLLVGYISMCFVPELIFYEDTLLRDIKISEDIASVNFICSEDRM